MVFSPKVEYDVVKEWIPIKHFHEYPEKYVVRPPYQRKTVWSRRKQKQLMDSLIRQYYVPRLVLRRIRTPKKKLEIIDGQQRIRTVQNFYENDLTLPESLKDLDRQLPNKTYRENTIYDERKQVLSREGGKTKNRKTLKCYASVII